MERWREVLHTKTYVMVAWAHRNDPRPQIVALRKPFGIDPPLDRLDPEFPELLLQALAREHRLYLYDPETITGSDVFGFIISRQKLDARVIQQIESWHWGAGLHEVYSSYGPRGRGRSRAPRGGCL